MTKINYLGVMAKNDKSVAQYKSSSPISSKNKNSKIYDVKYAAHNTR